MHTYVIKCFGMHIIAGGAGSDNDYEAESITVTFPVDTARIVFNYAINDDDVCELNETFRLTINEHSLHDRIFLGNPNQTIVTIIDEDCKLLMCD